MRPQFDTGGTSETAPTFRCLYGGGHFQNYVVAAPATPHRFSATDHRGRPAALERGRNRAMVWLTDAGCAMKDPADMMVRTSGPSRNELKREVHFLAIAEGFRRVRLGRYRRDDCTVDVALRIATRIRAAQTKFSDGMIVKSLRLSAGINLRIDFTDRTTK